MRRKLAAIIPHMDAVILSDYEYGLIDSEMRAVAADAARGEDRRRRFEASPGEFKGITLITPNESEAYALAGLDGQTDVEEVGRRIIGFMEVEALLITRGNKGMTLFLKDGRIHHIPIYGSDEIADVTGAGDTVAAAATLAWPRAPISTRRRGSPIARQGIVVMKTGTAVVTARRIKGRWREYGTVDS